MAYLLDVATLAEALRRTPSRAFVKRLTSIPTRDRWTSVITVSQLLVAARKTQKPKVMQDVIRLVSGVKVAPFDLAAAQVFAKYRAAAPDADTDDAMIAATAVANDFTLVTRRPTDFARFPQIRVENWIG
ncbi:MAG TPA: PIN domain-containing protein [Byssovorax sp.]